MKKDVAQLCNSVSKDVRFLSLKVLPYCDENQSPELQRLTEDEFSDDLYLENLLADVFEIDENRIVRWWNTLVKSVAFLDFSLAIIRTFSSIDQPYALKYMFSLFLQFKQEIELLFSALWFIDAFVAVHQVRVRARRARDKSRLRTSEQEEARANWTSSELVYFTSVTIQLLLIPVGFYTYVRDRAGGAKIQNYFHVLLRQEHSNQREEIGTDDPFAHYTLLYVVLNHVHSLLAAILHGRFQALAKAFRLSVIRELMRRFIARPFRFYQRTRRFIRFVQWTHYMGPIANKVRDLKLSIESLRVQYREERDARRAREARDRSQEYRNETKIREYAAWVIQCAFRSHHVRKTKALRALTNQIEYFAAKRLQRQFRASLKRARDRIKKNVKEYVLLAKEERMRRKQGDQLKLSQRKRMYELQAELTRSFQKLVNKELSLMPNTQSQFLGEFFCCWLFFPMFSG
jgi:hypothetical protein